MVIPIVSKNVYIVYVQGCFFSSVSFDYFVTENLWLWDKKAADGMSYIYHLIGSSSSVVQNNHAIV